MPHSTIEGDPELPRGPANMIAVSNAARLNVPILLTACAGVAINDNDWPLLKNLIPGNWVHLALIRYQLLCHVDLAHQKGGVSRWGFHAAFSRSHYVVLLPVILP